MESWKPRLNTDVEVLRDRIHSCPSGIFLRYGCDRSRSEVGGRGDGLSSSWLLRTVDPSSIVDIDGSRVAVGIRRVVDVDSESHSFGEGKDG